MGNNDSARPSAVRLPYVTPAIKQYGAVAAVTNANDMKGEPDGGPNNTRT